MHAHSSHRYCSQALFLLLATFAWTATATGRSVTVADARTLPTHDLAQLLLPDELAGQVLSHTVAENPMFGRPDSVTFQLPAQAIGPDMCQRDHLLVSLIGEGPGQPVLKPGAPVRGRKIALGSDCESIPPELYARVQPRKVDIGSASDALRWLARLQRTALDDGRLAAPVACRSDVPGDDPCTRAIVELVCELPLTRTYIIQPKRHSSDPDGWSVSIMPSGPGRKFWKASLIPDSATGYRVALLWTIPAPF